MMYCKALKSLIFGLLGLLMFNSGHAQSFWFGAKGGAAMNLQNWGNGGDGVGLNRSPMFSVNGDILIESYDEFYKGALYAQLGFHTRGSSLRFFSFNNVFSDLLNYKFRNIVLELGAKKTLNLGKEYNPYFILGIRGEYTVGTDFGNFTNQGLLFTNNFVDNAFVKKFNYGVTVGGGFEMYLSALSNVFAEFSIQPDLSFQYEQPPLYNLTSPWPPFDKVNIGLQQVRNVSIEAKVGIKFLRKVEYID